MKRKFKGKRKLKISSLIKLILVILSIILISRLFNIKFKLKLSDNIIKYIISENTYSSSDNIFNNILKKNTHDLINNPSSLLATNFYANNKRKEEKEINKVEEVSKKQDKPVVYLYNSHQKEEYSMEYMEDYNVLPTVQMAAYMIKERLDKLGLFTIVEENSISDYLSKNDMKYYQSYEASRHYLLEVMEKYDSIKFYLDIHRDAITHDASTVNINGVDCAKIMFVVGKEHDNYLGKY